MTWLLALLILAVVWLVCGAFNIAWSVAQGELLDIEDKRWLMAFGPLLSVLVVVWFLIKKPVQFAATMGTKVGQLFYDLRMN